MRNRLSNIIWGLLFIAIGVGIAGNELFDWNFTIFFPGWWTLFIIIPCFTSMIRSGFRTGSTIGFIIGIALLASYYIKWDVSFWELVVPVILVAIGLKIIFNGMFNRPRHINVTVHADEHGNTAGPGKQEYNAIFAGNKVKVTDRFTGATLNAVFGGVTLDLRDAIIDHDVEIAATAVFGGIDIYIPNGVSVKVNNVPIFGGVSNKAAHTSDPNAPTIYLNSTTMFGGIDIK